MKSNIELKDSSVSGFAENLRGFLKLLEDMENKKETIVSGGGNAPFDSKAEYNYTLKLGIEKNDFPFNRGFHPRQRPKKHPLKTAFLKSRSKR